jgi:methylated-DNA-[protein]-cysteine S-methyltransferase
MPSATSDTHLDAIKQGRLVETMRFNEKVWALTSRVPAGSVTTYRDIAEALGTRAYQAVGQAMHRNPHAPTVPCHRVVATSGQLHGYAKGLARKAELLRREGVAVEDDQVDLSQYHWPLA